MYGYYGNADSEFLSDESISATGSAPASRFSSLGVSVNAITTKLNEARPISRSQLRNWVTNTVKAAQFEANGEDRAGDGSWGGRTMAQALSSSRSPDRRIVVPTGLTVTTPDPLVIGPLFGAFKTALANQGASNTARSVQNVAQWYHQYLEVPAGGGSSSRSSRSSRSGSSSSSSSTSRAVAHPEPAKGGFMGAGKPLHKKPVFWTGIGVAMLLLGGVAFWSKKD